ncbi:HD domain-containing protein [Undibacterium pigrum]|uniref:HD domain-containing protein n=1 Tax=Undibacterium pigrum TaxID=401470 RepID=A0A318JBW9_9BURK|nr:HD domain-containing protein [Undibacterium pigrum]PXX45086.1 HD domain-containing protein [Undibacterium pigrum]
MLNNKTEAYQLLSRLGASERLLTHVKLVGEAAEILISSFEELDLQFDANLIRLGVAVHDAGKILHPDELDGPGSLHEPAGEKMLLEQGVQTAVARCCVTHAQWQHGDLSLEEFTVAAADKLWKGKREAELELKLIQAIAIQKQVDHWDIFTSLDDVFETIATDGSARLQRSRLMTRS